MTANQRAIDALKQILRNSLDNPEVQCLAEEALKALEAGKAEMVGVVGFNGKGEVVDGRYFPTQYEQVYGIEVEGDHIVGPNKMIRNVCKDAFLSLYTENEVDLQIFEDGWESCNAHLDSIKSANVRVK